MNVLRSITFAIAFYGWAALLSPFYLPLMLASRRFFWRCCLSWCRSCLAIIRAITGIDYEVRGAERLPARPVIIASKHQSAWDTLIFNVLVLDCAYVVKRELFWFPFFGWFIWRVGMIGIDRKAGTSSIKRLVTECRDRLESGRSVVIFPQGTRTSPGAKQPYLPGAAAIYAQCNTTVVPVALNSGTYWPRRRFRKFPGRIVVEFLEPIEPGMDRRQFSSLLESRIESATERLEAEARGGHNRDRQASA